MDSANPNKQTLVFADGYSYTEIFPALEIPGLPSSGRLLSVFHAFFTEDSDGRAPATDMTVTTE